jgi:hypothetical protein
LTSIHGSVPWWRLEARDVTIASDPVHMSRWLGTPATPLIRADRRRAGTMTATAALGAENGGYRLRSSRPLSRQPRVRAAPESTGGRNPALCEACYVRPQEADEPPTSLLSTSRCRIPAGRRFCRTLHDHRDLLSCTSCRHSGNNRRCWPEHLGALLAAETQRGRLCRAGADVALARRDAPVLPVVGEVAAGQPAAPAVTGHCDQI